MLNKVHRYLPVENWEYQYVHGFSTYPFLLQDISHRDKFLQWIRLAERYYIKNNEIKKNTDCIKEILELLEIEQNSQDAQNLLAYIHRADEQVDYLRGYSDIKNKDVLDFGSGLGMLAKSVTDLGGNYFGLEYIKPVSEVRDYFLTNSFPDLKLRINTEQNESLQKKLYEQNDGFDVIFCNNVLSEMSEDGIKSAITVIKDACKIEGIIVIQDWLNPKSKCMLMNSICRNFTILSISTIKENFSNAFVFILKLP